MSQLLSAPQTVKFFFPAFEFMWLVEETKLNLPLELDFTHEGRNSEMVGKLLQQHSWLKVGSPDMHFTTSLINTIIRCDFVHAGFQLLSSLTTLRPNKVPEVEWDLTTNRVLTMEYCDGVHIDDVDSVRAKGIDPQFISDCVGKVSDILG